MQLALDTEEPFYFVPHVLTPLGAIALAPIHVNRRERLVRRRAARARQGVERRGAARLHRERRGPPPDRARRALHAHLAGVVQLVGVLVGALYINRPSERPFRFETAWRDP
jgi:hypothetical protein